MLAAVRSSGQARYVGLHDWQVPELIGILPVILHLSLGLFFAGLVILLRSILHNLAIFVAAVVGTVYAAYVVFNILPLIYPRCPYRTALTPKLFKLSNWLYALRSVRLSFMPPTDSRPPAPKLNKGDTNTIKLWLGRWWSRLLTLRISASKLTLKGDLWRVAERNDALSTNGVLEANAVSWLYTSSYNPTAKRAVLEGLAGSPIAYADQYAKCWEPDVISQVEEDLYRLCTQLSSPGPDAEIDRQLELHIRALSNIQATPRSDFRKLYANTLSGSSRSPRLRAMFLIYFEYDFFGCTPNDTLANSNLRLDFFDEFAEDMSELRLTTSTWISLFRTEPDCFPSKSTFTILTILRDVYFFGFDSPLFSDDNLPSTDVHHPNEKMCKAMHAHISKQSLKAFKHLDDDSCDESPDALLRLLTLITTNVAYDKDTFRRSYSPLDEVSTEDSLEAMDVTLDCLLQVVENGKAHRRAITWSDPQKDVLAMLTTTPLFQIGATDLRDILPSVKRRVLLKTTSLIGLVYTPEDPLPSTAIPFHSAMTQLLLQMYMDGPDAKGQPKHEYNDSIALLSLTCTRDDNLLYKAFRKGNIIPILSNNLLESNTRIVSNERGDLTFGRWNTKYPQRSYVPGFLLLARQFLERYLAHIPTNQERASGSPIKILSSDIDQDKEYLFQPETLYLLCAALLLKRGAWDDHAAVRRMLVRLLKLKPDVESWIDCIQRLIRLPQSELSKYIEPNRWLKENEEERIGRLYRDIADMQSILGIDNARLEDPTWKQTVHFNVAKTNRYGEPIKSVCSRYTDLPPLRTLIFVPQAS